MVGEVTMGSNDPLERARRLEALFSLEIALWLADEKLPLDSSYRPSILSLGRSLASLATGVDTDALEFADMVDDEQPC